MVYDETGSDEDEEESEGEAQQYEEQEPEGDEQEGEEREEVDGMLVDADAEIGDLQDAIARIPVQSKRGVVEQEREDDEQGHVSFIPSYNPLLTFSTATQS